VVERFQDGGGIHCQRASLRIAVSIIPGQTLEVAIEDNAHEFTATAHHRASGVAANYIAGRNKIERSPEIQMRFAFLPKQRQMERRRVVHWGGPPIEPAKGRKGGDG